jgi:hypothetical protein
VLIESGLQTAKKLVATLGKVVRSLIINDPVADIKKPGPGTGQSPSERGGGGMLSTDHAASASASAMIFCLLE